ncbi:hypothetical protein F4777DRAFT_1462 [Nemania sp. FL0916]|nr:hypothetical protein F4777DRAFT_1462 [Nemania sp. FL0916]
MGNIPSVEASQTGSKATQKLSKPRTGNPTTAGLLSPVGVSDITRRPPSTIERRLSLPLSSTPVSSPRSPEAEHGAADDTEGLYAAPALTDDCSSTSVFRSDSRALHQVSQNAGVMAIPSRGRRTSRTDMAYMATSEAYEQAHLSLTASSPRNYNLSSHEAEQPLNIVEQPHFEDHSIVSESHMQIALSRRQSHSASHHPDAVALLPRTNSEASLYTPMRKRSLMTPGLATRPAPADLTIPLKMQPEYSMPSTPSRCDSLESTRAGYLSIPRPSFDPSLMPRALTPCESDYKQTGAFKHGTLRITNGSPARTPAWDITDEGVHVTTSPIPTKQDDYFDTGSQFQDKQNDDIDDSQGFNQLRPATAPLATSANYLATTISGQEAILDFLPQLKLTMSPFSMDEIESGLPALQTTSKHTAFEDELFGDGSLEYDTELLNLRFDPVAKAHPLPSPSLRGKEKDANQTDGGAVSISRAGAPHKALSKADSGYSSSVSVRSSSSKRNRQRQLGHSFNMEAYSPHASASEQVDTPGNEMALAHSTADGGSLEEPDQVSSSPGLPSRVSEKVQTKNTDSVDLPSGGPQAVSEKFGSGSGKSFADRSAGSAHHLSSDQIPTPTSTLGVSNARKPGRLHRLLSGARTPLAMHMTHILDKEAGVSNVSQTTQEKRAGPVPGHGENKLERKEAAKSAARCANVGNSSDHNKTPTAPALQENDFNAQPNQDKTRSSRSGSLINSLGSRITRAASSVMIRNPIKKGAIAKTKPVDQSTVYPTSGSFTSGRGRSETPKWYHRSTSTQNFNSLIPACETEGYSEIAVTTGRSKSLSAAVGHLDSKMHLGARHSSLLGQREQHAAPVQKSPLPGHNVASRTPPPVSMITRNTGSHPLRAHPTRPRSTPPARSGAHILSHKPSRENGQTNIPYDYPINSVHAALPSRPSQEAMRKRTIPQSQALSSQLPQVPGIPVVRSSNVPYHPGGYRTTGVTHSQLGTVIPREPSLDHSRRNSMSSQTSQRSTPSNAQHWPNHAVYDSATLRQRSSYDGYSFLTQQGYRQDNGSHRSLSLANGQTHMFDSQRGQPSPHQALQYQQHASFVSHGHHRHHSLDRYGSPVPYRVLHSYNSPAYRGVPIWSG